METNVTIYNKLVRDRFPEIIQADGGVPKTRILDEIEYQEELMKNLQEEIAEFLNDSNTEELADVMEVVFALAETLDCTPVQLEGIRAEKAQKRGGFLDRIFLEQVEK